MSSQGSNWLRVAWHGLQNSVHLHDFHAIFVAKIFEFRQNDFAALSAPPQLLKRRVYPAWDKGLKWLKCTMGCGMFYRGGCIWDGGLMVDSDSQGRHLDKGWLPENVWVLLSFADFCHFQLITLLKQETSLDLLGRRWFAHQFQSNLARVQNRLSMRRKCPATQQHRCLHMSSHSTPCDLHQYCPRSACVPQAKLAMKQEKAMNWESGVKLFRLGLFRKEKHSVNSG